MICIDSSASLDVVLGEAATTQLPINSTYMDVTQATGAGAGPYLRAITTNSTTAVSALQAPSAGIGRQLAAMSICNVDNVNHIVKVRTNVSATLYQHVQETLQVGDTLTYEHGAGWSVVGHGSAPSLAAGGRLTLTSGNPVADVTTSTNVYYTPYLHDRIALYDGSNWLEKVFTELTCPLGTLTADKNYDLFVWNNAGTLTLSLGTAWASDTARVSGAAGAITRPNGVYVNQYLDGSIPAGQGRYVGTIRTVSTTQTADSAAKRFCWNVENRVRRAMSVMDATSSWDNQNQGASWAQARASSANQLAYVCGLAEDAVEAASTANMWNSTTTWRRGYTGVGVDTLSLPSGTVPAISANNSMTGSGTAVYRGLPGLGYHYLAWVLFGGGGDTQTWESGGYRGITGTVMA